MNREMGSPFACRIDVVRDYFIQLRARIEGIVDPGNAASMVTYHNYYTVYCVALLGIATGIRAIGNPFPDPEHCDPKTGFALVRDKDGNDGYNTRIIWLPKPVRQQLLYYRDHRRAVISLIQWPENSLRAESQPYPMFLLNPSAKKSRSEFGLPAQLRPGKLTELVGDFFYLPMNFDRHFLRSNLLERGVSIEALDMFMGHWHLGTEPWGRFSTYSMRDHKDQIRGPITDLLNEIGATPRKSQLC